MQEQAEIEKVGENVLRFKNRKP